MVIQFMIMLIMTMIMILRGRRIVAMMGVMRFVTMMMVVLMIMMMVIVLIIIIIRDMLPSLGGYLIEEGCIHFDRLELFTRHMGSLEHETFIAREKEARKFERRNAGHTDWEEDDDAAPVDVMAELGEGVDR